MGELLVKSSAKINARDKAGNTALMVGVMSQREAFARWIFEAKADVAVRNKDGEDAVDLADALGLLSTKSRLEVKARTAQSAAA
mmetsp:Transcript_68480/g.207097  ORF Transcript_68480/g.207097 Transcript_68480/m.207097 type:complete len:84 (+) Transcript_68480:65-316(+)